MLLKIKKCLCSRDYYKIAIIIICLNSVFELIFQYRFQADMKMEGIYFLIMGIVSAAAIKNMIISSQKNYLPAFYCFWPIIMSFIFLVSTCKLSLLPLLVSSFILLFCGRYKQKLLKIVIAVLITVFVILIALCIHFFPLILLGFGSTAVKETVYSYDNRYMMILEEFNAALDSSVEVHAGRNINFGPLGRYIPKKTKYYGYGGERPAISFVNDDLISINGEIIEMKGRNYLSNNEFGFECDSFNGESAAGEIIRYKNEDGNILRYKINLCDKNKRIEDNYYFAEDNTIYFTRLEETYSSPYSSKTYGSLYRFKQETDILSGTFNKGTIIDGQLYYDNQSKSNAGKTDDGEKVYRSLEELNIIFLNFRYYDSITSG